AFRAEEMNDVLKSLTVYDSGGGSVSSVSYDNKKPISKLLSDISLNIPSEGGSVPLLASLRGAEVAVTVGSRTVEGQIVGVDTRMSSFKDTICSRELLTLYDERGRLQTFDLDEVTSVAFQDEELQNDMRFLFATVFSAKKQDAKSLKVFSRGEGERTLSISYVVECPVWKTSYRVALSGSDSDRGYLQGWALVDNPQDEDWKDIELSLVSGLPISFRHDLYSPRYLMRREVEVETESSAGPVMTEGALFDEAVFGGGGDDLFAMEMDMPAPAAAPPPPPPKMKRMAPGAARASSVDKSAAKVETITQKTGQLFEYKIDRPVTVLRNQSALVPIVADEFEGGKKLLYNESQRAENPYSVVDFKNTTGLTLEGGPVTVYEGEIYAGEAMMDTLAPDEERMLPYAVALEVEVKVERERHDALVAQSIANSIWTQKRALYEHTTYRLVNKGEGAKKVVVEHPLSNAELINSPKPDNETRNFWRFTIDLPANGKHDLKLTEKTLVTDRTVFSHTNPDYVLVLINGIVGQREEPPVLAELKKRVERMKELGERQRDVNEQIAALTSGQQRLRENLKSLGNTEEEKRLRSRYVSQMDAEETKLNDLKEEMVRIREESQSANKEFFELAGDLSLERVFEEQVRLG
ncbi:MAG: hypothetical protein KC800_09565, partial [Candidatus Eremiobacteraeota bacterium]|nr:hypothetical protein [Candidatus Eremiobacteraeota bacterium]